MQRIESTVHIQAAKMYSWNLMAKSKSVKNAKKWSATTANLYGMKKNLAASIKQEQSQIGASELEPEIVPNVKLRLRKMVGAATWHAKNAIITFASLVVCRSQASFIKVIIQQDNSLIAHASQKKMLVFGFWDQFILFCCLSLYLLDYFSYRLFAAIIMLFTYSAFSLIKFANHLAVFQYAAAFSLAPHFYY